MDVSLSSVRWSRKMLSQKAIECGKSFFDIETETKN
jgi:hypothetical protein